MLLRKYNKTVREFSPAQIIVLFYIMAVTISFLLLSLPIAHKQGVHVATIDTLFVAISAVSVTGLSPISTVDTFSTTGMFILMFVFQFGGLGVMMLSTFIWLIARKKIGLKQRQLIMTDQNQSNLSGLVNLMRQILFIIIIVELIGALLLGIHFYLYYYHSLPEALLRGLFASVSATTNAGFDITGNSLVPYADDYYVQMIHIFLIALGAIGFPVLIEIKQFFLNVKSKRKFRFSLFTKLTSSMFLLLLVIGTIAILLLEGNHFLKGESWHKSFFYALFQSSSTRSGGLATMDVSEFTTSTLLVLSALMFIGASPSSVGGGIRTTTFALNILFIYNYARGKKQVRIFKRELHEEDIIKSLVVTIIGVGLCSISVIILSVLEPFPLVNIMFEVCSAFGTTGLSTGITGDLSNIGKIIIMILMFIGRVGILLCLFILRGKGVQPDFHYPKERVIIG
ncbi:TrkH family potassium uptake protein [Priestia endophytica]|uniref:Trk-type K+ transport system, membrane component n=1 Tax=Priestia endophytica DSM 13796 TaxID=1121089 RepID=A0A1I5XQ15_9BACI|nr:TrkH family potassium uptake protein [Priestia endophytica]KAB2496282.1 TrkH family potassium uptake protein [Priestia endophytica]KYG31339.1 ATP synthase [Priestia endophytica]MBG9811790.1 ATP synthase [Priestia endophytica]SFQ33827.1 Trk-type K+ transport system, membrane component [Priestia endophytica DSM 13796]